MKPVVVVGGGIAGLAAAYELHKASRAVTLIERDRLGGLIRTERHGDFLIEAGPDSFITQKPWAKELCEELGLGERLIPTRSRRFHVLVDGELKDVPEGVFLTVPTKWGPFLTSGLISFTGKLRMAMDLFLPRGPEVEDESIGSFIRRRLGQEALEKLAEPIMAGIYVASADELSLRSTFPRFAEMEREHRSLIKAFRKAAKAAPPGGATSPFLSLRGGMQELVDRLVERMAGVTFVTGKSVEAVEPGWKVRVGGETIEADHVILAIPAWAAAKFLPGVPSVKYVTTHTVSLAYPKFREMEATGFVIPRAQQRPILACTWTSSKFEGRAPADRILVRCFLKGDVVDPVKTAHDEMRAILGAPAEPLLAKSFSWPDRNAVYEVGHERRILDFEAKVPAGLHLCGSGFHGTGIPDCIKDGRAVARRILGT